MKFNLKTLFWLVAMVALVLAVAGYSYKLGMEAGRIKEAERSATGTWTWDSPYSTEELYREDYGERELEQTKKK